MDVHLQRSGSAEFDSPPALGRERESDDRANGTTPLGSFLRRAPVAPVRRPLAPRRVVGEGGCNRARDRESYRALDRAGGARPTATDVHPPDRAAWHSKRALRAGYDQTKDVVLDGAHRR